MNTTTGQAFRRLHAARRAIDATRADVLLTARAECYLTGHPDPLRESVRRLQDLRGFEALMPYGDLNGLFAAAHAPVR